MILDKKRMTLKTPKKNKKELEEKKKTKRKIKI